MGIINIQLRQIVANVALFWWHMENHKFFIVVMLANYILASQLAKLKQNIFFQLLKFSQHFIYATFKHKILTSLFFKNCPLDPCIRCPKFCDFVCGAKSNFIEELDVEFEHEVEHEEISKYFNAYITLV
jgi:hypothetical protein